MAGMGYRKPFAASMSSRARVSPRTDRAIKGSPLRAHRAHTRTLTKGPRSAIEGPAPAAQCTGRSQVGRARLHSKGPATCFTEHSSLGSAPFSTPSGSTFA